MKSNTIKYTLLKLVQSSQGGVYVFSTHLLQKIPVFKVNTRAVNILSIVELLQLVYNFLTSSNKVSSFLYTFFIVSIKICVRNRTISAVCFRPTAKEEERVRFQ